MNDTTQRLCGRVDGAIACAQTCWRERVGLDDEPCPMPPTPSARRTRNERGSTWAGLVVGVCWLALVVFALVLLAGWFDYADARDRDRRDDRRHSHGCRWSGQKCKPVKGKPRPPTAVPTSTPTPIAPGCVEYGPDCVIDLTTTWPTTGPVVIVQHFPCPLSPLPDAEPCVPVTTTETVAP